MILLHRWSLATAMALGAMHVNARAQATIAIRTGPSPSSEAMNRLVTVTLQDVSLEDAIAMLASRAKVRVNFQGQMIVAVRTPVTLRAVRMPLGEALERTLSGTGMMAEAVGTDAVVILMRHPVGAEREEGSVSGVITDATTKRPIGGARVSVDESGLGVTTDADGRYTIPHVPFGSHRITVRMLGYDHYGQTVTVTGTGSTVVNMALSVSANTLDQVVVTGTVIQTELKAVPNAITVITAKDIEQRGITKIDQLFRGDVPGLFAQNQGSNALLDEVTMFSRGTTSLSPNDPVTGAFTAYTNPIKTYVDGVELADAKYLSQIDPKSIERIEILTGPQASTIYGSNAINGVMQVFTKRGTTSTPQLTLNLLSGWVENNFSSARTPQHDYSAQLSGVEGRLSYNAGGSWNYMGPWTPAKQLTRTSGFGGARLDLPTLAGRVTADITIRRSMTRSQQHGNPVQTYTGYRETGWYSYFSSASGLSVPQTLSLTGQTLGLVLSYVPTSWWSHELGVGQDASDVEQRSTARGYTSISDTTLSLSQSHTDRRSLRYATTVRVPMASFAQATLTAGSDAWQNLSSSWQIQPQTLTGPLTGATSVSRQPGHNAGAFLQSQLGVKDRLFFTYGLRAEWNPNFGEAAQPNYAPRYGVAYTQEMNTPLGPVTAKLRGSYGRSTRPPLPGLKVAQTIAEYYNSLGGLWSSYSSYFLPYYGIFDIYRANPDLGPEHQQGGEGGLELYLGTHGSLIVTRYNQTVDGLIAAPQVDSVRSFVPCTGDCFFYSSIDADGYAYYSQYQYLNVASIRNQGWELQSSLNMGPLTTRGTYSWTKSRTIGVNPKYRAYFTDVPEYQPGATFKYLPEHTWALGVTYAHASSSVTLNLTGTGRTTNQLNDLVLRSFTSLIRLPQNRLNVTNPPYISFNSPYTLADLAVSHHFLTRVEGVLQVQNLTDHYTNDYWARYASIGRQLKLGARVRTQ